MLVDVVPLRERGKRRPRGEVKADKPKRGELTLTPGPGSVPSDPPMVTAEFGRPVQMVLYSATVTRMQRDHFLVHGRERHTAKMASTFECSQVWWCRVVRDADGVAEAKPRVSRLPA